MAAISMAMIAAKAWARGEVSCACVIVRNLL
jgi:hypothetical protein